MFLNILLSTSQYREYKQADTGNNFQRAPKPSRPSSQVNGFLSVYKMAGAVVKDRIAGGFIHVAKD